jgi:hypothetical protein
MSPSSRTPVKRIVPAEQVGEASDRDLEDWGLTPLLDYWKNARGDAFAPRWADFNLMELPRDVRGGLVVVDHDPVRDDFRVRFWGVDLWDIFGIDVTGAWLSEVEHFGVLTQFLKYGTEMLKTKAIQKVLLKGVKSTGEFGFYPVLRLPISDDGINVTKIVTVRNAKRLGRRREVSGGDWPPRDEQ